MVFSDRQILQNFSLSWEPAEVMERFYTASSAAGPEGPMGGVDGGLQNREVSRKKRGGLGTADI